MDSNRTSSVYSSEQTYLDYRPNTGTSNRPTSTPFAAGDVSQYQDLPVRPPPTSHEDLGGRPSYMNYQNGNGAKTEPIAVLRARHAASSSVTTVVPTKEEHIGTVLLAVAGQPHASTISYVETLLRRQRVSTIAILGREGSESSIKQLKMDVYALLGKMRLEVDVQMYLKRSWKEDEIFAAFDEIVERRNHVNYVICHVEYDSSGARPIDLLSLEQDDLEGLWGSNVGFLHAVAKCSILGMSHRDDGRNTDMFLVMGPACRTPASFINKAACDTMVMQLQQSHSSHTLTIGHAEEILIGDSEPEETNPSATGLLQPGSYSATTPAFTPSESPTKLWNMWALQNDVG